jgi:hypothetical protein
MFAGCHHEKVTGWRQRGEEEDNKQGRQDGKELICYCFFHYVVPFLIAEHKLTGFPWIRLHSRGATYPGTKLHDCIRGSYNWDGPEGSGVLDSCTHLVQQERCKGQQEP